MTLKSCSVIDFWSCERYEMEDAKVGCSTTGGLRCNNTLWAGNPEKPGSQISGGDQRERYSWSLSLRRCSLHTDSGGQSWVKEVRDL